MNPWNLLFPLQKYMKQFSSTRDSSDMEAVMKDMFSQMSNSDLFQQGNSEHPFFSNEHSQNGNKLQTNVFETHHHVFVRISLSDQKALQKMKIYHTSNSAIIEGYPKDTDKHIVTLPAIVTKKGATAHHKENVLEIRFTKASDLNLSEIPITELK